MHIFYEHTHTHNTHRHTHTYIYVYIYIYIYNLNSHTSYSQWPFLRIILDFYQATHISLIQNDSY